MQSLHRVEKSPPSDGTGGITAGDLSTQRIIGAVTVCLSYRHAAPLEMTKEPWRPTVMLKKEGAAGAGVFGRQDAEKKKPLISRSFFFRSNGD